MNFITEKAQLEKENKEVGDMDFSSPIVFCFFTEAKNYEFYHRKNTARERKH